MLPLPPSAGARRRLAKVYGAAGRRLASQKPAASTTSNPPATRSAFTHLTGPPEMGRGVCAGAGKGYNKKVTTREHRNAKSRAAEVYPSLLHN